MARAARAEAEGKVEVGAAVKVTSSVVVYHVPKSKGAATDLEGLEGVVAELADVHEGVETSATLPYKVAFQIAGPNDKPVKFAAHLERGEFELA